MALADIFSTALQFNAAEDAAQEIEQANLNNIDLFQRGFRDTEANLQPFIETGTQAQDLFADAIGVNGLNQQQAFFRDFEEDPGFQEALDRGIQSIGRFNSAKGMLNSGGTLKDLSKFTTDSFLNNAFNNRLNRLQALGNQGFSANNQLNNAIQTNTFGKAGAFNNIGKARADREINQANAITNGVNNLQKLAAFESGGGGVS